MLFLVCWWPRLNSQSGHLKRSVNFIRKLGQKPTGLPLCFPRKSSRPLPCAIRYEHCVKLSDLCFPILVQMVWLCQQSWQASVCLSRQLTAMYFVNLQQTGDNLINSQFPHLKNEKLLWMRNRSWCFKTSKIMWFYDPSCPLPAPSTPPQPDNLTRLTNFFSSNLKKILFYTGTPWGKLLLFFCHLLLRHFGKGIKCKGSGYNILITVSGQII